MIYPATPMALVVMSVDGPHLVLYDLTRPYVTAEELKASIIDSCANISSVKAFRLTGG